MNKPILLLSLFCFHVITASLARGEPFRLPDGTVLNALEIRKEKGIVKWIKIPTDPPTPLPTPWGTVPAQGLVLLYSSGRVQRVSLGFVRPLVERTVSLNTPFGALTVKDDITFHENGSIASLSFKGVHQIPLPLGTVIFALGATFYPSGALYGVRVPPWNLPTLRLKGAELTVTDVKFHENGTIQWARLKDPVHFPTPSGDLKVNQVDFYDNGEIRGVSLSEPVVLSGLPARSLGWYRGGTVEYLELSSSASYATPWGVRSVKDTLYWHPDGRIKQVNFSDDFPELTLPSIGKVRVSHVSIGRDGHLESLSFPDLTPIRTPAGTLETYHVDLYPAGTVRRVDLSKGGKEFSVKTPLGPLKAGSQVTFFEDGALESLSFALMTAHEVKTPVGTVWAKDTVSFYPNGSLAKVELSTATLLPTALGILALDYELIFYPSGTLKEGTVGWHPSLGQYSKTALPEVGEAFIGNIRFYPNGKIRQAEVIEKGVYGGLSVEEGETLLFSEDGKLVGKGPPISREKK